MVLDMETTDNDCLNFVINKFLSDLPDDGSNQGELGEEGGKPVIYLKCSVRGSRKPPPFRTLKLPLKAMEKQGFDTTTLRERQTTGPFTKQVSKQEYRRELGTKGLQLNRDEKFKPVARGRARIIRERHENARQSASSSYSEDSDASNTRAKSNGRKQRKGFGSLRFGRTTDGESTDSTNVSEIRCSNKRVLSDKRLPTKPLDKERSEKDYKLVSSEVNGDKATKLSPEQIADLHNCGRNKSVPEVKPVVISAPPYPQICQKSTEQIYPELSTVSDPIEAHLDTMHEIIGEKSAENVADFQDSSSKMAVPEIKLVTDSQSMVPQENPTASEKNWPKLCIDNLPKNAQLDNVRGFLEEYGLVRDIREEVKNGRKRVVAVMFEEDSRDWAVECLDGSEGILSEVGSFLQVAPME